MEKKEINLINLYNAKGERHGLWECYHTNGQLIEKSHYVNDRMEGYWERYYDNGQLSCKGHYVNGIFQEEKPEVVLTMDEIAKKFGVSVEQLKITKE